MDAEPIFADQVLLYNMFYIVKYVFCLEDGEAVWNSTEDGQRHK